MMIEMELVRQRRASHSICQRLRIEFLERQSRSARQGCAAIAYQQADWQIQAGILSV